jgi:hypothetical protein
LEGGWVFLIMDTAILDLRTSELPITETMLCAWYGAAMPGDRLVYHRGFLAIDVSPLTFKLPEPDRRVLLRLAERALKMAEAGLVHLVQQRIAEDAFTYIAIARSRPAPQDGALEAVLIKANAKSVSSQKTEPESWVSGQSPSSIQPAGAEHGNADAA